MRLGVIVENLIESFILRSQKVPEPLLETQMAFSMARSIMVGARSAPDSAKACEANPRATEKLLNALAECGYFTVRDGLYTLTPKSEKWLLRRSPYNLCDKILFQYYEWDFVEGYEDFVRHESQLAQTCSSPI